MYSLAPCVWKVRSDSYLNEGLLTREYFALQQIAIGMGLYPNVSYDHLLETISCGKNIFYTEELYNYDARILQHFLTDLYISHANCTLTELQTMLLYITKTDLVYEWLSKVIQPFETHELRICSSDIIKFVSALKKYYQNQLYSFRDISYKIHNAVKHNAVKHNSSGGSELISKHYKQHKMHLYKILLSTNVIIPFNQYWGNTNVQKPEVVTMDRSIQTYIKFPSVIYKGSGNEILRTYACIDCNIVHIMKSIPSLHNFVEIISNLPKTIDTQENVFILPDLSYVMECVSEHKSLHDFFTQMHAKTIDRKHGLPIEVKYVVSNLVLVYTDINKTILPVLKSYETQSPLTQPFIKTMNMFKVPRKAYSSGWVGIPDLHQIYINRFVPLHQITTICPNFMVCREIAYIKQKPKLLELPYLCDTEAHILPVNSGELEAKDLLTHLLQNSESDTQNEVQYLSSRWTENILSGQPVDMINETWSQNKDIEQLTKLVFFSYAVQFYQLIYLNELETWAFVKNISQRYISSDIALVYDSKVGSDFIYAKSSSIYATGVNLQTMINDGKCRNNVVIVGEFTNDHIIKIRDIKSNEMYISFESLWNGIMMNTQFINDAIQCCSLVLQTISTDDSYIIPLTKVISECCLVFGLRKMVILGILRGMFGVNKLPSCDNESVLSIFYKQPFAISPSCKLWCVWGHSFKHGKNHNILKYSTEFIYQEYPHLAASYEKEVHKHIKTKANRYMVMLLCILNVVTNNKTFIRRIIHTSQLAESTYPTFQKYIIDDAFVEKVYHSIGITNYYTSHPLFTIWHWLDYSLCLRSIHNRNTVKMCMLHAANTALSESIDNIRTTKYVKNIQWENILQKQDRFTPPCENCNFYIPKTYKIDILALELFVEQLNILDNVLLTAILNRSTAILQHKRICSSFALHQSVLTQSRGLERTSRLWSDYQTTFSEKHMASLWIEHYRLRNILF